MVGNRAAQNVMVIRGIDGSDGKGILSTAYNASTGVLTITFSDNSTYNTADIRGAKGDTGKGIASTAYNASTGILTITFTDSSTYQTGDLRGISAVNSGIATNITGLLKGNGSAVSAAVAGTDFVAANDSRLSDARTPTSHAHGNITNSGAIGSTSGVPVITGASGVLQAGSFGIASGTYYGPEISFTTLP